MPSRSLTSAQPLEQRPPKWHNPDPTTQVVSVEPVGGWWTSEAQWGNRFQGEFPGAPGDVVPVQNMVQFPGPPREIGISLFRTDSPGQQGAPIGASGPQNAEIYAQLIYGAGGVSNTVLIDWANGVDFTLPCSSLRINAVSFTPRIDSFAPFTPYNNRMGVIFPPPAPVPPVAQLFIAAEVGLNGASRSLPPSYTTQRFPLPSGGALNFSVPEFARIAIPLVSYSIGGFAPLVLGDFGIMTSDSFGNIYQELTFTDAIVTRGLDLPGRGSGNVQLVNTGPTNARCAIKFLLGI